LYQVVRSASRDMLVFLQPAGASISKESGRRMNGKIVSQLGQD
jgi:hypothetical protein